MKKNLFLFSAAFVLISSCQKEGVLTQNETGVSLNDAQMVAFKDRKENYLDEKLLLANALVKTMRENRSARALIKEKALEMFNNDYEVLFEMIKDERIGATSLKEAILKNIDNPDALSILEREAPTLTILVPELPKDSFSAKLWNIDSIPAVAVQRKTSNEVPIIYKDGQEGVIEPGFIPRFPVLVIKDNERVFSERDKDFASTKTREFSSKSGTRFKFIGKEFDGKLNPYKEQSKDGRGANSTVQRTTWGIFFDPVLIQTYHTYLNQDGWQRDAIYYNITPNSPNGPFSYDFQEYIKSFTMLGDPLDALYKISDQSGEPRPVNPRFITAPMWTEGFFELKFKTLINAKNGVGDELVTFQSASPSALFFLTYHDSGPLSYLQNVETITFNIDRPIFNWNLDEYASSIKISVEEVDIPTTTTSTDTRTVKFATNFGFDGAIGQKVKQGLKFGLSLETTETSSVTTTITEGNDELGSCIVNFADDFIISRVPHPTNPSLDTYSTREYNGGWFSISVEPRRVQGL